MIYTPQKLAWIIGHNDSSDEQAIKKVIEHLEWEQARPATPEEREELSSAVRQLLVARDDARVYGDTAPDAFHAGAVMRDFMKK